jgi:hypothetical protein
VKAVVNGVGAGQYGVLSLGPSNELFVGGESTNPVTFSDVPDGALDFVAARLATPIAGATAQVTFTVTFSSSRVMRERPLLRDTKRTASPD